MLTALSLATALVLAQPAPARGVYQPAGAPPVSWSIGENLALTWNGQPYAPVGARIEGTPEAIQKAADAGIKDVIVELPSSGMGWSEAFAALEKNGMRYVLAFASLVPMAKGYAIEPQAYRLTGITKPQEFDVAVPGASRALTALVLRQDASLQRTERINLLDGRLKLEVRPLNELEHILLIYPEMRSLKQADFWEAFDEHRDNLLIALRRSPPGPGLRGILNPMGEAMNLAVQRSFFVPSSPAFRAEFRTYLENKYRSVDTALRSWQFSISELKTFDQLAGLVPLWNGARGIPQAWDPATDKLYPLDARRSTMWTDIQEVLNSTASRRFDRLVRSIRSVADVPVLQEWRGWASAYEGMAPALDGIGMRAVGASPTLALDAGSRAASTVLRWQKPGWLVATEVSLGDSPEAPRYASLLQDLADLGSRAAFVRLTRPEDAALVAALAGTPMGGSRPLPLFFPENALNPATPQRLSGGRWWLPAPLDGNRLDLGVEFSGYRMTQGDVPVNVIWSNTGSPRRVQLRMIDTKSAIFETIDGSDPDPRRNRRGLEITIGSTPLVVKGTREIPVPQPAFEETVARFDQMLAVVEGPNRAIPAEESIFFKNSIAGFEKNPGGSMVVLRDVYQRLVRRVAPYTWIEAEAIRNTNFSEPLPISGTSGGQVLSLSTPLGDVQEYYASFAVPVRSTEDQELWIAARLPEGAKLRLGAEVGSQRLNLEGEGVSVYGPGFRWYRLGTTRLAGNRQEVRIVVQGGGPVDLAIDAILLTPIPFRPNGVFPPDPMVFAPVRR